MTDTERSYGVNLIRGPFVKLPAHEHAFDEADEDAFVVWAAGLDGFKVADLFCGAGGLSLGLEEAGLSVVLGVDHDTEALETHRALCGGLSVNWDLADDSAVERVIRLARAAEVNVVVGGPPCQPFSKAGRSMIRDLVRTGRRHARDNRRDLWESFIAVVEGVRPRVVLMENVPDMALDRDMQILRTMVEVLEGMGYAVAVRVLETARFEVPQFRQRLILVALADGIEFEWPAESGYQVTLRTAIGDLPVVEGGWRPASGADGWIAYKSPETSFQIRARECVSDFDLNKVFDHITRPVREDDKIIFAAMDSDTLYTDIDEAVAALDRLSGATAERATLKRYRDDIFDDKYKRLDWNRLSRTITAHIAKDGYWYIHPDQERTLTIREAARIQTFPDHIRFAGPPSAAFRQIGNAVPPRLGELLGLQIVNALKTGHRAKYTTIAIARRLATWFEIIEAEGRLRFPWLAPVEPTMDGWAMTKRWPVIQAEMLLGRARAETVRTLWPIVAPLRTPSDTLKFSSQLRDMSQWIDRASQAERVLEAALAFSSDPTRFETVGGMRSVPNVTEAVAEMAARVVPGPDEDPVLVTKGVLRVAARHGGTSVDRRNARSDGRIELARLIGAEDSTSDHAFLALVELAEWICTPSQPKCPDCPLSETCITANG